MEQPYQQDVFSQQQRPLPNATAVLVLGILSIVVCFVCGIIALIISANDKRMYEENPGLYSASSYDLLKAGRICSIISLCLIGAILLFILVTIIFAISFQAFSFNN